ncbi:hypothetical protein Tco_1547398 [Tanacetum coccineum]
MAMPSPRSAPPSPDYVPGPKYPEYLVPSDDEVPIEDQSLRADASPTALSLSYVANSDPDEDHEEDLADYSANEDDEEEESSEEDDDEDKEEEHLALANSALPAIDSVPSAEETEPFETNESTAKPPPPPQTIVLVSMTRLHRARISKNMHFLLSRSVVYVLTTPIPEDGENATVERSRRGPSGIMMTMSAEV